ncbi:plasminogen-like [Haliotis rufescens]|uniref:plasminogen-like n=1 Tax=Haliotis rufescens TaxID=6454 RepID=UPI00201E76F3|nr:plasminogen-like [Haliotis rufescens]
MARLLLLATLAVLSTLAACNTDCYTKQGGTAVYSGTQSETSSGKTCQSWSAKTPNNHGFLSQNFDITNGAANLGYPQNYCRDPSSGSNPPMGTLWCYTADGEGWDTCTAHKCP